MFPTMSKNEDVIMPNVRRSTETEYFILAVHCCSVSLKLFKQYCVGVALYLFATVKLEGQYVDVLALGASRQV